MKKVEILAPAGSIDGLKAVINAGCDAAYIGGAMFGARAYANNLDEETMKYAIDYTHVHGKQLYLTVNTLLKTKELEEQLYHYLEPFYKHGLDAVIVQDVGVMNFIHHHFKELPIHASTQITLTMAEGAKVFEDMGVTRLVTSRELSLKEIARVREHTNLEIETFVHGALCYSFSGQCLMSSMLGGRSGNRGRCAQPCRMEYTCQEGGRTVSNKLENYLLSPKDICTLDLVADAIEAGINSFKIEGRMKRPQYAAGVVAAYKEQVDQYYELGPQKYREYHNANPGVIKEEMRKLQDLYNRGGFSSGYFKTHNGKNMMSMQRPNHSGVLVGKVTSIKGINASILLNNDVNAQDILEIRMKKEREDTLQGVYEFTVKEGKKNGEILRTNFMPKSPVKPGDEVYRTKNNQLLHAIEEAYLDSEKKVGIKGVCIANPGQPLTLTLTSSVYPAYQEKDITITVTGDIVEAAMKQPMTEEKIRTQLMKTNETAFAYSSLDILLGGDVFLPVSKLNELRRSAMEKLEAAMSESFRRESKSLELSKQESMDDSKHNATTNHKATTNGKEYGYEHEGLHITAFVKTKEQLEEACNCSKVDTIYLDMATFSFEQLQKFGRKTKQQGKCVYLVTPHIVRASGYDALRENKESLNADWIDGFVIKNFESFHFFGIEYKDYFIGKELRLDYNMYVMNEEAKKFYKQLGITHTTASVELNEGELKELGISRMDIVVYGHLPLMVSAQCVKKNTTACRSKGKSFDEDASMQPLFLTDRRKKSFEVLTNCRYCYNTILNAECLSLASVAKEVKALQPYGIRLDFTTESKEEVRSVLQEFITVFIDNKKSSLDDSAYTKGHFRRGIM